MDSDLGIDWEVEARAIEAMRPRVPAKPLPPQPVRARPKELRHLVDTLLNFNERPELIQQLGAMGLPGRKRRRLVAQALRKAEKREAKAKAALAP